MFGNDNLNEDLSMTPHGTSQSATNMSSRSRFKLLRGNKKSPSMSSPHELEDYAAMETVISLNLVSLTVTDPFFGDVELEDLCRLVNTLLSPEIILAILSFLPISLQRYDLSPTNNRTIISFMIKNLFGYFKNDRNRNIYCIFKSFRGRLHKALGGIPLSLQKCALSFEYMNHRSLTLKDTLSSAQSLVSKSLSNKHPNKLMYIYLMRNNDNHDVQSNEVNNWIKNQLMTNRWSELRAIHLSDSYIIQEDVFHALLDKCPNLSNIEANISMKNSVEQSFISTENIHTFSDTYQYLTGHPKLKKLELIINYLNDDILRSLLANNNLQSLKLKYIFGKTIPISTDQPLIENINISNDAFCFLPNLNYLSTLHLIGLPEFNKSHCESVSKCQALRALYLQNCNLSSENAKLLIEGIQNLEILDLSYNKLSMYAFEKIDKTKLLELVIIDVDLNDDLIYVLSSSKTIKRLAISGNQLTDNSIKLLFDYNLNLTHLTIVGNNSLTNNGLRFIKDGASDLVSLSLCINERITNRGIQFLAEHSKLKSLTITKSFKAKLIPGVDQLLSSKSLETLNLSNIQVTLDEISHLTLSEQKNIVLQNLFLTGCQMDEKIANVLFEYCTNIRVLSICMSNDASCKEEWAHRIGTSIARLSTTIEELHIEDSDIKGARIICERVLFHHIASLQSVFISSRMTSAES
jgi:hypothetical protein